MIQSLDEVADPGRQNQYKKLEMRLLLMPLEVLYSQCAHLHIYMVWLLEVKLW